MPTPRDRSIILQQLSDRLCDGRNDVAWLFFLIPALFEDLLLHRHGAIGEYDLRGLARGPTAPEAGAPEEERDGGGDEEDAGEDAADDGADFAGSVGGCGFGGEVFGLGGGEAWDGG